MICELLIIGSVAINPCRVIEMTPSKSSQVVGRNWIGFSKWDFIPDGGCWVQLSTEGRRAVTIRVPDVSCADLAREVNNALPRK